MSDELKKKDGGLTTPEALKAYNPGQEYFKDPTDPECGKIVFGLENLNAMLFVVTEALEDFWMGESRDKLTPAGGELVKLLGKARDSLAVFYEDPVRLASGEFFDSVGDPQKTPSAECLEIVQYTLHGNREAGERRLALQHLREMESSIQKDATLFSAS